MTIQSVHAGHGGKKNGNAWTDPGAVGNGYKEADVARTITDLMVKKTGAKNVTDNTSTTSNGIINNVAANINKCADGWQISNHLNAFNGKATGVEVLYGSASNKATAAKVSAAISKTLGLVDRGAKDGSWLGIARNSGSGKKVLLIEWGFIDNKKDMQALMAKMEKAVDAALAVFGYATNSAASKPSSPPTKPSTPAVKPPVKPSYTRIAEDGMFGPGTANRAMEYEGMTPDDEISHQYRQACNKNLYAAEFDKTLIGSNLIRTWQKRLRAKGLYKGAIDGLCGTEMIKAMQRALKTTVDGVISSTSEMVKALQRALNNNKLPW
ncbi:N-acetylmuramoyl-L-alanine amidase [Enterococcus casseliflavus]|uniref:N-acetylmuramoyl-L-alanine amidase n=1 Tax=Enterococcus casseliflavus TaxID=37734 RepID=UPI002954189F|nr:N-acetylmuramoyl-L-alanine amidase [Enterococcus casseliflavus]MDV7688792.1 N-acetylmuramoyl-L-alanine amidase [Enterococcus casseliflavus]